MKKVILSFLCSILSFKLSVLLFTLLFQIFIFPVNTRNTRKLPFSSTIKIKASDG